MNVMQACLFNRLFHRLFTRRLMLASVATASSVVLMPRHVTAQTAGEQRMESHRRISVDVTGGSSAVRGGRERYVNDAGVAAEVLIGLRRPARFGPMYAVSVGVRFDGGQNCFVVPPDFTGGCVPYAPTIRHIAVMPGYEYRRSGSSLRALLGPALFSDGHHEGAGGRLHVSAAVGAPRVALTAGVNGNWLTLFNGTSFRYYSSAFGIRLQ